MKRLIFKRLFCNKTKIKESIESYKQRHLQFNKNLENITKEFSLYEIKTINNRRNFLDPSFEKNELEKYVDSFDIEKTEVTIDLKTLASLNFPIVLYSISKENNWFNKYIDILTKSSLITFLLVNAKFLLSYNFLFNYTVLANITLFSSTITTYYLYISHKTICQNSILEMKVNPQNKTITITYINTPFTFPIIVEIPINLISLTLNPERKSNISNIKYYLNINTPKLKNKQFYLEIEANYYQEAVLCRLFNIREDNKINDI